MVQRERFAQALEQTLAAGVKPGLLHMGNSSAVDEGSTMAWLRETAKKVGAKAVVRTGFAIYGHCLPIARGDGEDCAGALAARLKPVMTWKTRIIGLRDVEAGTTVGYGATFVAKGGDEAGAASGGLRGWVSASGFVG